MKDVYKAGKHKEVTRTLPEIPDDMIQLIFKKLHLQLLCTFMSVSKSWHSIIIRNFYETPRRPIPVTITNGNTGIHVHSIDGTTGKANHICTLKYNGKFHRLSYFNGLFYFLDCGVERRIWVCNPHTQEIIQLPKMNKHMNDGFRFDLGFDLLSKKYKMLNWGDNGECEIFTFGSEEWREITNIAPSDCGHPSLRSHSILGVIYWYSSTRNEILYFNVSSETFGVIEGPQRDINQMNSFSLFEFEGCLCLKEWDYRLKINLWMLTDDRRSSWVMIASVVRPPMIIDALTIPYSTRKGEVVLVCAINSSGRYLHFYSFITRQFESIKVSGLSSTFNVTNYVDNSVSLNDF